MGQNRINFEAHLHCANKSAVEHGVTSQTKSLQNVLLKLDYVVV